MDESITKNKPKTKKGKIKKATKVKLTKVTTVKGFVTGILVCLC